MKLPPLVMLVLFAVLGLGLGLGGCARVDTRRSERAPTTSAELEMAREVPNAEGSLPPLRAAWLERLELDGGGYAYAALPIGAREKRIVVVGVHGAGDRPDWSCSEWQAVTAGWAFVVCPVGVRHPTDPNAFVWGSAESIASNADKAVRALRARYGAWMDDGPLVYGGWSQGATLASQVISSRKGAYDRAVLVEVGHTPLDANQVVAALAAGGVKRAVVSCSSGKCRTFAKDFEGAARRKGLPVRTNDVGNRGHWFDEPVFRTLGPTFVWMFEEDRRYAGLGAAVDARYSTD